MKYLIIFAITGIILLTITCCVNKKNITSLNTVNFVDLKQYTGRWFEIARYPHRFEKGCSEVTADYSLKDDGTIEVLNKCRLEEDGNRIKKAHGKAFTVGKPIQSHLTVKGLAAPSVYKFRPVGEYH